VITARLPGDLLLLAPVRGLASEVGPLLQAVDAHRPAALGLGLSPDEMRALAEYFVVAGAEPIVPLTRNEASEVRGLVRFGEVRVPNPSFVETMRWAQARGLPAEALDPTDDRTASMFAEHIGYVELVRRTVRERRVARAPPTPATADQFALEWDREVAAGRGSRAFAQNRDRHFVRAARKLAQEKGRLALVVDRERFPSVQTLLTAPPTVDLDPG
jgi:hypothetical protein